MAEKNDVIRFRCSPAQRRAITKAAKAVGMTLSGYILWTLGVQAGEKIADVLLDAIHDSDTASYDLAVSPLDAQDAR